jgi:hypothetical protein
MQITHCCTSFFQVIALHQHSSWEQIKGCQAAMGSLCPECAREGQGDDRW